MRGADWCLVAVSITHSTKAGSEGRREVDSAAKIVIAEDTVLEVPCVSEARNKED